MQWNIKIVPLSINRPSVWPSKSWNLSWNVVIMICRNVCFFTNHIYFQCSISKECDYELIFDHKKFLTNSNTSDFVLLLKLCTNIYSWEIMPAPADLYVPSYSAQIFPVSPWTFRRRYFEMHFCEWKVFVLIKISLKCVSKGPIDNNPALV